MWVLGATANAVVSLAYAAIAIKVLAGLQRPFRANPLALATGLIFLSCSLGHLLHVEHLILDPNTRAHWDWHMGTSDTITAIIGVVYWHLRSRFPALVRGAALFEDFEERQKQALALNDSVVQQIAIAKFSLEMGDIARAEHALQVGLEQGKAYISGLRGQVAETEAAREVVTQ